MHHHSQFSLFALLIIICVAVSSCSSTTPSFLSSDPQAAEDILRESTKDEACVVLMNGDTVMCYSVAVRKDSTRWQYAGDGGEHVLPTDSIASIDIPSPQSFWGALVGIPVGVVGGAVLGPILAVIYGGFKDIPDYAAIGVIIGIPLGAIAGAIDGWKLGAANGTIWTREPCSRSWDFVNNQWIDTPINGYQSLDTTQTQFPH